MAAGGLCLGSNVRVCVLGCVRLGVGRWGSGSVGQVAPFSPCSGPFLMPSCVGNGFHFPCSLMKPSSVSSCPCPFSLLVFGQSELSRSPSLLVQLFLSFRQK